jgi:hypothetical protein
MFYTIGALYPLPYLELRVKWHVQERVEFCVTDYFAELHVSAPKYTHTDLQVIITDTNSQVLDVRDHFHFLYKPLVGNPFAHLLHRIACLREIRIHPLVPRTFPARLYRKLIHQSPQFWRGSNVTPQFPAIAVISLQSSFSWRIYCFVPHATPRISNVTT